MRKDLLKRLDDLIGCVAPWGVGPIDSDAEHARWLSLRAELVAERCENCKHWGYTWPGLNRTGACDEFPARPVTKPDFYCANFVKKES